MSARRALAAAALAVASVASVAPPGAVAAPAREYVLVGSTTSYIDVAFYTPMAFSAPVIETRGRFAGVYVEQLSSTGDLPWGGWIAVRGLSRDASRMDPVVFGQPARVAPGVARIYLVADGPTTVRFSRDSGPQGRVTFRPRERASAHARVVPLKPSAGVWSAAVPLRLAPESVSFAAVQIGGRGSLLADVDVCVRAIDDACRDQPLNVLFADPGLVDPLNPEQRWTFAHGPGRGPEGDAVAEARVKPVDPLSRAVLAGFVLTRPGQTHAR